MLPEVEAYFDVVENIAHDRGLARHKAREDNPVPMWSYYHTPEERTAYNAANGRLTEALNKTDTEEEERQAQALQDLAKSDNPLVRWLAEFHELRDEYRDHADEVLRNLPMTREEIEAFGDKKDWCGEYRRLYRLAERAGVLPEYAPELADIEPLVAEFTGWYGGDAKRFREMINKHIPAILESAQQKVLN